LIKTNDNKTYKYGFANPDIKNKNSDVYESHVQVLQAALKERLIAQ